MGQGNDYYGRGPHLCHRAANDNYPIDAAIITMTEFLPSLRLKTSLCVFSVEGSAATSSVPGLGFVLPGSVLYTIGQNILRVLLGTEG